MIRNSTLKYLAAQKKKDAKVLLKKNRNAAAVYLMGYALELSLKRQIAIWLGLMHGFPESPSEFKLYFQEISNYNSYNPEKAISTLRQLKNHNLNQLITLSGQESRIKALLGSEWHIANTWNPENRYKVQKFGNQKASAFIIAAKTILNEIT